MEVTARIDFVSSSWMLAAAAIYLLLMLWVRQNSIRPSREWLLQRLQHLRTRSASEEWKSHDRIAVLLETHEDRISGSVWVLPVSRVQAGWRLAHAIEDEHLAESSKDEVMARLGSLQIQLASMGGKEAEAWANRISLELKEADEQDLDAIRGLLQEASVYRHNVRDTEYEELSALLDKAMWLASFALGLILALGSVFHRELFFVMGAAGGLVSRLTQVLRKRPARSDYGAARSTLLLSPVTGALAGSLGVLATSALARSPFDLLNSEIKEVTWDAPSHHVALTLALLFGFSERLFSNLLGRAEEQLTSSLTGGSEAGAPAEPQSPPATGSSPATNVLARTPTREAPAKKGLKRVLARRRTRGSSPRGT